MPLNLNLKMLLGCATLLGGVSSGQAFASGPERPIEAAKPVSFTVALPLRNQEQLRALLEAQQDPESKSYHQWLTPAEFGERFGPTAISMERVVAALQKRGFEVSRHTRGLSVRGTPDLVERTFGTSLRQTEVSGRSHFAAATALRELPELSAEGAHVIGFEAFSHKVMSRSTGKITDSGVDNRFGPNGNYYFTDLKQAYEYPAVNSTITVGGKATPFNGTGATIGTVISSDVLDSDITSIFDHEHYATTTGKSDPTLYARRPVNGGAAFDPESDASFEASLDIQAEMGGAPGAHVVLYNIPSLYDSDIIDGYTAVIDDNVVDAVSSSFGECESYYLAKYENGLDQTPTLLYEHELYEEGNAQGITFLASSGDSAGKECISLSYFYGKAGSYIAGASTPATDPNVTAVGGTNVVTAYDPPTLDSTYAGENAWLDQEANADPYGLGATVTGHVWGAGGGPSVIFAAPAYQSKVTTGSTMRMTPDIGMQVGGCPGGATDYNAKLNVCNGGNLSYNGNGNTNRSDYTIYFGGDRYGVIGTSVSSPELTGALALLIEKKGRQGNVNNALYTLAKLQAAGGTRFFHTLIPGYNGVIQSNISSTYNVSTGVGTPIVRAAIGSPNAPAAGLPQTPSNP